MKNILNVFDFSNLISLRTGFVSFITGWLGTFLGLLYGGKVNLIMIAALVFAIAFDWAGAIAASKRDGSYASQYGIQGILRTAVMICLPAWGTILDKALGTPGFFFYMLTGGLLFHTTISMIANFKRAGWDVWIPIWALDWIASEIEAKIKRSQNRTNSGDKQ